MNRLQHLRESKEILDKIKKAKCIKVLDREKNLNFLFKYSYSIEEVVEVVKNLNEKNYRYKYKNLDKNIKADYLYVFHQLFSYNYNGIDELKDIFIKVCYTNVDDSIILVISFHEDENYKDRWEL